MGDSEAQLVETSIDSINPFYPIERLPLVAHYEPEDGEVRQISSGYDSIINADTGIQVGVVSSGYNLIPNIEVVDILHTAFSDINVGLVTDHMNANGSSWIRSYVFDSQSMVFDVTGDGDVVKMMFEIMNSYNGKSSLSFRFKMWRMICSNGLMGWDNFLALRFRHTVRDILDKIRASLDFRVDQATRQVGEWSEWTQISYNQEHFNKFIDLHVRTNDDSEPSIFKRFLSPRQAEHLKLLYEPTMNEFQEQETKWGAYNVITAIATHHIRTRRPHVSPLFTSSYDRLTRLAYDFHIQPEHIYS